LLWIAAAGTGTVALSQSTQDISQDQRILRELRRILENEHAFDGMSISPNVKKGVVTLNGTVGNQAAKVLATTEIQKVEGIKSVMNNLNVVGGTPKPAPPAPSGDVQNKNVIFPFGSILPVHVSAEISSKIGARQRYLSCDSRNQCDCKRIHTCSGWRPGGRHSSRSQTGRTPGRPRRPHDCAYAHDLEWSGRATHRRFHSTATFEQSAGCRQWRDNRRGVERTHENQ
jgi:hypothetical protein